MPRLPVGSGFEPQRPETDAAEEQQQEPESKPETVSSDTSPSPTAVPLMPVGQEPSQHIEPSDGTDSGDIESGATIRFSAAALKREIAEREAAEAEKEEDASPSDTDSSTDTDTDADGSEASGEPVGSDDEASGTSSESREDADGHDGLDVDSFGPDDDQSAAAEEKDAEDDESPASVSDSDASDSSVSDPPGLRLRD